MKTNYDTLHLLLISFLVVSMVIYCTESRPTSKKPGGKPSQLKGKTLAVRLFFEGSRT